MKMHMPPLFIIGRTANVRGMNGLTALHRACSYSGAHNTNAPMAIKNTLLLLRDKYGSISIDPNKAAESSIVMHGVRPLHMAALAGNAGLIQVLVAYGADVTLPCSSGQTPQDSVMYVDDVEFYWIELATTSLATTSPHHAPMYVRCTMMI